ncbi:hypothetical protein GCM10027048_27910 [Hymenobacter coalescens]
MKKRLRKKLGRGEYANPYRKTRRQREAEALLRHQLESLIAQIGPEEFVQRIESYTEKHPLTCSL